MPVCFFGSERQPETPRYLVVEPQYFATLLPAQLSWVVPFLPLIPRIELDMETLCTADAPGWPDITASDVFALITRNPWDIGVAAGYKFAQLLHNVAWYRFCKCVSGGIPSPPTAPTAPDDLPSINLPYYFPRPNAAPCLTYHYELEADFYLSAYQMVVPWVPMPPDWYQMRVTTSATTYTAPFPGSDSLIVRIEDSLTYGGVGASLTTTTGLFPPPTVNHKDILNADYTGRYLRIDVSASNHEPQHVAAVIDVEFWCSGTAADIPSMPCCPPDENTLAMLRRIDTATELIQRQIAPFSYVLGAEHEGLEGQGSVAVQGLLGVRVQITAMPGYVGVEYDTPEVYFNIGSIAWATTDGDLVPIRVTVAPQLDMPPYAGIFTRIDYTLNPGVVMTLTELRREP